jgi:hypothetical protein
MANTGEPLIHVVRSNKPKGLRGLNHKGGGQVEAFPLRLPQMGIRMKLSIDSRCKFNEFVLLSHALSQGLGGSSSLSRCLGRQTLGSRTGLLQKAPQGERGLKDHLHPTICEGLKMADEFEQTQFALFLQPEVMTYLGTERIIDENEEHTTIQIT